MTQAKTRLGLDSDENLQTSQFSPKCISCIHDSYVVMPSGTHSLQGPCGRDRGNEEALSADLKVAYVTSAPIPLTKTQSCGPTLTTQHRVSLCAIKVNVCKHIIFLPQQAVSKGLVSK